MSDQAKIKLSGVIHTIFPPEIRGSFEKRVLWLHEEGGEYPQCWPIEFQQGNVNLLERYQAGDKVEIRINLKGFKWTKEGEEKCMATLVGWSINMQRGTNNQAPHVPQPTAPAAPVGGDLPF